MSDFESKYRNWHTKLSYLKSAVRIAACVLVMGLTPFLHPVWLLSFGFFIAEVIGIIEEWV